jgi:hypothetical protein
MEYFARRMPLVVLLFASLICQNNLYAEKKHLLNTFNFNHQYPSPCEDTRKKCYDVVALTKHALMNSYESREKIEQLFQARKHSLEKLGALLPHVNIGSVFAMAGRSILDFASSFVGFLFPSRRYVWQANRQHAAAELESLKTLLANRAHAVQEIYYAIYLQIWSIRIYEHYIEEIEHLIEYLQNQRATSKREVSDEAIGVLINIGAKLKYDLAYLDKLPATYAELAQALGIEINENNYKLPLLPQAVRSLRHKEPVKEADFLNKALTRSTEVTSLEHLLKAAQLNKKSTYYDFFDPESNNNLGYGYKQRIRVSRSAVRVIGIHRERTESQISLNVFRAVNDYNDALIGSKAAEEGLEALEDIRKAMEEHVRRNDVPFDINQAVRYFEIENQAVQRYCTSYFLYKIARASLDRYVWEGKVYQVVQDYIREDIDVNFAR